jgi:hypothetical protein
VIFNNCCSFNKFVRQLQNFDRLVRLYCLNQRNDQHNQIMFRLSHKMINAKNINRVLNETINVVTNYVIDNPTHITSEWSPVLHLIKLIKPLNKSCSSSR